jgi:hypothetical protein
LYDWPKISAGSVLLMGLHLTFLILALLTHTSHTHTSQAYTVWNIVPPNLQKSLTSFRSVFSNLAKDTDLEN